MEYTIKQLANLSGVSTRTLRYYDEIDLLKPKRIGENGYRIYETEQIDTLEQNFMLSFHLAYLLKKFIATRHDKYGKRTKYFKDI